MPRIEVIKDFAFAECGIYVIDYVKGDIVDVSDECAECALKEKWAKPSKVATPAVLPAETAAPEIAAAEAAPETK